MEMSLKEALRIGQEILLTLKESGEPEEIAVFEKLIGCRPITNQDFEVVIKFIALYQFHLKEEIVEYKLRQKYFEYEMALKVLLISHDSEAW